MRRSCRRGCRPPAAGRRAVCLRMPPYASVCLCMPLPLAAFPTPVPSPSSAIGVGIYDLGKWVFVGAVPSGDVAVRHGRSLLEPPPSVPRIGGSSPHGASGLLWRQTINQPATVAGGDPIVVATCLCTVEDNARLGPQPLARFAARPPLSLAKKKSFDADSRNLDRPSGRFSRRPVSSRPCDEAAKPTSLAGVGVVMPLIGAARAGDGARRGDVGCLLGQISNHTRTHVGW